MADRPRGLFILFEGFPATVIRSQVVALAAWLGREGITHMDILSFACSAQTFREAEDRLLEVRAVMAAADAAAEVTLYRGLRPALPGAAQLHRWRLRRFLAARAKRYAFIHARTDLSAATVAPVAAAAGIPLIWDCRGDAVAEALERAGPAALSRWLMRFRARQLAGQARAAAAACRDAIFVSETLRERWRAEVGGRAFVVPTIADDAVFRYDPALRAAAREELGVAADTLLFVFSGSLSAYQGFERAVAHVQAVRARQSTARLLVLTPQVETARAQTRELPGTLVLSAPYERMNRYLNAADYALLCRPESAVNRAAFPTKFAEYGLAGLPVVMSRATPDCVIAAERAGNYVDCDAPVALDMPDAAAREAIAAACRGALSLASQREVYTAIYRQPASTHT